LEQTEGVPATICELCSVRLEDWHSFREQCIGSDEYLRVTLRHAFYPDEGQTSQINPSIPVPPQSSANLLSKSIPSSYTTDSSDLSAKASFMGRNVSKTPPPPASSRLSLAKRRQSTFEFPVTDGKGNTTDQTVLVEVLGVCKEPELTKRSSYSAFEQEKQSDSFSSIDNTLLEQASWSKEYCARVNNLMVVGNGPRPFKCKVCRRMFNNRTNLRRHIKALHADEVLEGESPPPECYGYGQPLQSALHGEMAQPPMVKKKRKSTDPPITGPYKCEVCPRSFKMPAHLAVHRKTHRQIDFDQSELSRAIEQQKRLMQQQQRERSSSAVSSEVAGARIKTTTTIEPGDIIQLSDDDDDEEVQQVDKGGASVLQSTLSFGASDDLDDGFDEEEGSSKETSSLEADLRPDPSSLAIVEIGAEDNDATAAAAPVQQIKDEDEDVMVVQDGESNASPSKPMPGPSSRASIPPGPLSSKLKYTNQVAAGSGGGKLPLPKPLLTARPIEDLQRKQKPEQQQTASSSATPSVHRCHLCRHTFPREDLLRDHQKSHQHDSPCAYRCGWCKKGFRYRQNYTLHLEKQTCRLINADPVRTMQQQQQQQQPQQPQAGKCT
uniref:C2H2-type domain-containing protein n=1 Tax=Anopheles maculatus TaxID=74869 RepID=A0A182T5U8_9DIPT